MGTILGVLMLGWSLTGLIGAGFFLSEQTKNDERRWKDLSLEEKTEFSWQVVKIMLLGGLIFCSKYRKKVIWLSA